jgi:hypothetical protein
MLGAALGVAVAYALSVVMRRLFFPLPTANPAANPYLLALAFGLNSASLGFVLGALTVLVARFLAPDPWTGEAARSSWQPVAGITLGFVVGGVVAYPAEFAYVSNFFPELPSVLGRYFLGGVLMGLGIAVGFVLGNRRGSRVAVAVAIIGAMFAGLVIGELHQIKPTVGLPTIPHGGDLPYVLHGALLGAGLAGGWLAARHLRWRWQMRQVGALFSRSVIEK